MIDGHQETLEGGAESARTILQAGGRLGMGGDYGFAWNPHGDYAKELTFFVKYVGFTPLETIKCATKTGAEILGRDNEIGTLEAGKLADVLVVDGDVVADISLLEAPRAASSPSCRAESSRRESTSPNMPEAQAKDTAALARWEKCIEFPSTTVASQTAIRPRIGRSPGRTRVSAR